MRATTRVSNTSPFAAYGQAAQTVAKTQQVVMLYDGAVRFMKQAKEAAQEKRIESRYKLLVRVSDIVMGLQSSLDFETGGDIAQMLYDFYASLDARIMGLHRSSVLETYDEIIAELKEMRDVWASIDKTGGTSSATATSGGTASSGFSGSFSGAGSTGSAETDFSALPSASVAAAALRAAAPPALIENVTLSA